MQPLNMNNTLHSPAPNDRPGQLGRFITLEGIDGAGKSTALNAIRSFCEHHHIPHHLTREPGGTALGESIRQLFLNHAMHPKTEVLLAYAARLEHIQQVITPCLNAGEWVISDRYEAATYAYQGGGRGLDTASFSAIQHFLDGLPTPDLTLLLDLSVADAGTRRHARNTTLDIDRFEAEASAFHERVRDGYLNYATTHSEMVRIDASQPIMVVHEAIQQQLARLYLSLTNHSKC
jgi:dTMP kinase